MRYNVLGGSGLIVSELALGTWTFGHGPNRLAAVQKVTEQARADAMVSYALERGVNLFNSADTYYGAEEMLGLALGPRRHEAVIATKIGMRAIGSDPGAMQANLLNAGLTRRHLIASLDASLRRLGTDYIDICLAHIPDRFTCLDDILATFDDVVRQGKVRYIGISNWPAWMAASAISTQAAHRLARFRMAEVYYSAVCRDIEHDYVPLAEAAGLGLAIWSPLAGGLLTGKYQDGRGGPSAGRLADFNLTPADHVIAERVLACTSAIASRQSCTPGQVAIAWLLRRPAVSTVILGASSLAQLTENLSASALALSDEDIAALDKASAQAMPYPANLLAQVQAADHQIEDKLRYAMK